MPLPCWRGVASAAPRAAMAAAASASTPFWRAPSPCACGCSWRQRSKHAQQIAAAALAAGCSLRWFWGEMQSVPKKGRFLPPQRALKHHGCDPLAPTTRLTTSHQRTQACRLSVVGRREVVGCRLSVVAATGRRTSVVGCKSQRGADTFRQKWMYNVQRTHRVCRLQVDFGRLNLQPTTDQQKRPKYCRLYVEFVGCRL